MPRDESLQVQAPTAEATGEAQRPGGNDDLRRPAIGSAGSPRVPDPVPIESYTLRVIDQTVHAGAGGIDLEKISGTPITVRIQNDRDRVIPALIAIPLHAVNGNALWMRIMTAEAKVQSIA